MIWRSIKTASDLFGAEVAFGLKKNRNIGFEQILFHLSRGDVWKTTDHPDQQNYPGQKIYFVVVDDYMYLVPHVIEKNYTFLKTVIPSRKATKMYQKEKEL